MLNTPQSARLVRCLQPKYYKSQSLTQKNEQSLHIKIIHCKERAKKHKCKNRLISRQQQTEGLVDQTLFICIRVVRGSGVN